MSTKFFNKIDPSAIKRATNSFFAFYEESLGLSVVTKARNDGEEQLFRAQVIRREKQTEINHVLQRLREIKAELDRTNRGEDRFLQLLTEEHETIKKERQLSRTFDELETKEREAFQDLSNKVRISHEREREREERTKYWSLTGSLIGAILGIIGTTIANEVRMKHLREMIPTSQSIVPILDKIANSVYSQQEQFNRLLSEMGWASDTSATHENPKISSMPSLANKTSRDALDALKSQNAKIADGITEIKRLIHGGRVVGGADDQQQSTAVVYIGQGVEELFRETEQNIASKIKVQTLISVVAVYSAAAIVFPLVYYLYFLDR